MNVASRRITNICISTFLLARLESAYSLIWGSHTILKREVGTPWHFYDK